MSWFDDKELSSGADTIGLNSLKKKLYFFELLNLQPKKIRKTFILNWFQGFLEIKLYQSI